ncbi:hypothetical protein [Clostridium cochlearium]
MIAKTNDEKMKETLEEKMKEEEKHLRV